MIPARDDARYIPAIVDDLGKITHNAVATAARIKKRLILL
jgi:hypothetical protein